MQDLWYPLTLEPLYETADWGGDLLAGFAPSLAVTSEPAVSTVHLLIDHGDASSTITNGRWAGKTLRQMVSDYPEELVSFRQHPEQAFPLRARYLDVARDRPLEVHGDDANGQPLSKFWYVLAARPHADLVAGISYKGTASQFVARIGKPELRSQLETFSATPGDAYYITPGKVNAIGAGNLIYAVDQSTDNSIIVSPLTPDPSVPLGGRDVIARINFIDRSIARIRRDGGVSQRNRKLPLVTNSPSFLVDELRLVEKYYDRDSRACQILVAVQGDVQVDGGGVTVAMPQGGCCLIPAAMSTFSITPAGDHATVLRTALRVD